MDKIVLESLNKIRNLESKEVLTESTAAAPVAQAASKGIGRFIPGVGAALGAYDAYNRAKKGDWTGAAMSGAGGLASLIPGVGTAASLGIAGAQALRDKQRTGSYMPDDNEIAAAVAKDNQQPTAQATAPTPATPTPPGADPKVLALQQQLIAKGAKIKADGKMGPATQTAMKQFPDVKMAEDNEENKMSESQKIAELMSRLAQLEQAQPQVADEGIADLAKGAWGAAKNFGSAVKTGFTNPEYAKVAGMATRGANKGQVVNKAASAGAKTGKALNTTAKVGAGAAVGAGTMAALSGGAGTKEKDPVKPTVKPTATPPTASTGGLTPQEEQELALLAADMAKLKGQNSELDALIDRHLKIRPDAGTIANPE
jgi:peptidoglycan hydrolase-like protein with peptidoglycan-binding domain